MFASAVRALVLTACVGFAGCAAEVDGVDGVDETSESHLTPIGTGSITPDAPQTYDAIADLSDGALKRALLTRVKDHNRLGYNVSRKVLYSDLAFAAADGKIECTYTGRRVAPTRGAAPAGFNAEHSWPQSRGAGREPARSDLHHLFAVDAVANSSRGNWPFGTAECLHDSTVLGCSFAKAGSALGKDADGSWAFEVRAEKRGDIARAQFYFAVRYELAIAAKQEATLRAWHDEDPVDATEQARNDGIERYQHNRNPFVDRPDFVAKISDF